VEGLKQAMHSGRVLKGSGAWGGGGRVLGAGAAGGKRGRRGGKGAKKVRGRARGKGVVKKSEAKGDITERSSGFGTIVGRQGLDSN